MLGTTVRQRRSDTAQVTQSEFHNVRVQEFQRDRALEKHGLTHAEVAPSYFVPTLQSLCADVLAKNFASTPDIDTLRGTEHNDLYQMILQQIPTPAPAAEPAETLPLRVRVQRIVDESHWRRCCEARWSLGQISKFAGERLQGKEYGWKRLFLERVLCDFLLSLRGEGGSGDGAKAAAAALKGTAGMASLRGMNSTNELLRGSAGTVVGDEGASMITEADARTLAELCAVSRDYVHTVELPCQFVHLHLYEHLFSKIPGILHFTLTYGAASTGIGFDRSMIGFTDEDAQDMRMLLCRYPALETLRLPRNKLTPSRTKAIAAGLVSNTTLRVLDLSCNALDDEATAAIALLLCRPDFPLEELDLSDNDIRGGGAVALAEAFAVNKHLRIVRLSQNRIPDADGGDTLLRAIPQQPTITELRLAHNKLGPHTAQALLEVLPGLQHLAVLDLAGNGAIGGVTQTHTSSIARSVAAMEKQAAVTATTTAEAAGAPTDMEGGKAASPKSPSLSLARSSTPVFSARPSIAQQNSESGPILCEAVAGNTSLQVVDVRFCNLTEAEVSAIESTVHSRVQGRRAAELSSREAEVRVKMRAAVNDKIFRMHSNLS